MTKLTKDVPNAAIFGVCSGLAKYSGLDVSVLRLVFLLGAIFSGSLLFWIYLILAIVMPKR